MNASITITNTDLITATVIVLLLIAAACGSDDNSAANEPTSFVGDSIEAVAQHRAWADTPEAEFIGQVWFDKDGRVVDFVNADDGVVVHDFMDEPIEIVGRQ